MEFFGGKGKVKRKNKTQRKKGHNSKDKINGLHCYQKGDAKIPDCNYDAINSYLRASYQNINVSQIKNKNIQQMVRHIDREMLLNKFPRTQYFYRGINTNMNRVHVLHNKAYTSCSESLKKAKEFQGEGSIIKFVIPPYIKTHIFENTGEKEVLLQRNTWFTKIGKDDNDIYEVLVTDKPPKKVSLLEAINGNKKVPIFNVNWDKMYKNKSI